MSIDELIARLRGCAEGWRGVTAVSGDATLYDEAADTLARYRDALNAIIDRAPERDVKWAGMTARDIALFAIEATTKIEQPDLHAQNEALRTEIHRMKKRDEQ